MYEPLPVSSEQVGRYHGLVEHSARKFAKLSIPLAEQDDLVQVGLIRVWTLLRRGIHPTEWAIEGAMKNELRRVSRQNGEPTDELAADDLDAEFLALDGVGI